MDIKTFLDKFRGKDTAAATTVEFEQLEFPPPEPPEPDEITKPEDEVENVFVPFCTNLHPLGFGVTDTSLRELDKRYVCKKCNEVAKLALGKRTTKPVWNTYKRSDQVWFGYWSFPSYSNYSMDPKYVSVEFIKWLN